LSIVLYKKWKLAGWMFEFMFWRLWGFWSPGWVGPED
jgi:hypothetical protein